MGKMGELAAEMQQAQRFLGEPDMSQAKTWPKEGCELVEHDEPGLQGLFQVRYIPTGKVLRDRLHQTDAFKLVQFGFDLLLEAMDAQAQLRLESMREFYEGAQQDSKMTDPAEGGKVGQMESESQQSESHD